MGKMKDLLIDNMNSIFEDTSVDDDSPSENNSSVKGLIHHILDWNFTQGMEVEKLKVALLKRISSKQEKINELDSMVHLLNEQLEEEKKSKKKSMKKKKK